MSITPIKRKMERNAEVEDEDIFSYSKCNSLKSLKVFRNELTPETEFCFMPEKVEETYRKLKLRAVSDGMEEVNDMLSSASIPFISFRSWTGIQ